MKKSTDPKTPQNSSLGWNEVDAVMLAEAEKRDEQALLAELDAAIDAKSRQTSPKTVCVKRFTQVPEAFVFAEKTRYRMLNRSNNRIFIINGCDLERRLGADLALYNKVKSRKISTFCIDNAVISFCSADLPDFPPAC